MKRCRRTILFVAILIAAAALESDQVEEEPEKSWKDNFIVPHVYLKKTTDIDGDGSGKPRVSLCCRVGTFLTGDDCVEATMNGTEAVQLPKIYENDLILTNVTASDEYFDFVVWNPCAGAKRYPLNPHIYDDEEWYLLSNGSILRPLSEEPEERLLDYRQYCLARVRSYEYREYLVFFCEEAYAIGDEDNGGVIYSFGMLASVPFLAATYIVYWMLPDLRNLHGLTLRGYVGCLATAYSMLGVLQLTPQEQIPNGICIVFDVYEHATNDSEETSVKRHKKLDEIFQLTVYDPCQKLGRFLLDPDSYPQDRYTFLANGSLYQPYNNEFVESYCLAVPGNKYEVSVCFDSVDEIVQVQTDGGIPVGLIVSLPFLLTTFVVYSILPELRNMHGYTLRGYVGSLFVAYTVLAIFQLTPQDKISDSICIAAAFIIHFSFLASFFWLNVMCFDIWWTFGGFRSLQGSVKQRERKKFVMYSIYAWGSASIFTIICAIMDFVPSVPKELIRPEFGAVRCWFNKDEARALYFYGPMSVTVVCNICLFISTALKIVRHKKDTAHHLRGSESRRHDDNKQWFNLYLKLFIVMGINWSMEIVSWLFQSTAPPYVWYLTDLTNTLQGLIIFIIFVWKEKIKRLLLKRFGCQDRGPFSSNSTRSVCHSSASRTCTTTTSTVMPLQEKISPYVQTNCRTKSSSDEADP